MLRKGGIDGQKDGRMDGQIDMQMNTWTDDEYMDRRTNGQTDSRFRVDAWGKCVGSIVHFKVCQYDSIEDNRNPRLVTDVCGLFHEGCL